MEKVNSISNYNPFFKSIIYTQLININMYKEQTFLFLFLTNLKVTPNLFSIKDRSAKTTYVIHIKKKSYFLKLLF